VILPENRNHLGARGFVVYLYTSVDQQVARTVRGRDRPLLEGGNPREILEKLLEVRDPLYREIADLVIDTDGRKVRSVVDEIVDHLKGVV
jgi:shikimate kinase